MTYQQFDEKLQSFTEMTPAREQKLRARWQKISRRGLAFYVFTRGLLLAAWILFCFILFSFAFRTQYKLMANHWAIASIFIATLFFSLPASFVGYRATGKMVETLDLRAARNERKLRQRPGSSLPSPAPETAP